MKTNIILAFLLSTQPFLLNAQYSAVPLECSGKIPEEFLSSSQSKYQQALRNNAIGERKQEEAKMLSRFELEGNFNLDELLRSGRVLFNDEASNYLDEVSQVLLQAKPLAGRQSIKIYALRSGVVNAFATSRGEVFVTLGLLAQLENEAQLAYIIAHELAHVEQRHSLKFYLESEELERTESRSVLKRVSTDEKLLRLVAFSKENEQEADRLGLDRMLASPYRTATLSVVFNVLKYSYLPFADQPFERSLLASALYRLPDAYWLEKVKPIEGEAEDEDDIRSSHPNIKSRREAMLAILNQQVDAPEKSDYIVSKERFESVRRLARNELPNLYLHADQHADAIYAASLLLQENPESLPLKKYIAKALYLSAKFQNSKDYVYEGDYREVEGESQQVHYLLEKIPAEEMTMLAWHFAWQLHRAHPDDTELSSITKDLFFEFAREYGDFDRLKNEMPPTVDATETAAPVDTAAAKELSEFERIDKPITYAKNEYWHYAFAGELNDETFVQYQENARKESEKWRKNTLRYATYEGKKEIARLQKKGLSLNIPRVAIVNPFYLKLDARKKESMLYIDSEEGQEELRAFIKETSARAGLETTLLDVRELNENDSETFNDIRYLNEWFAEQSQHFDLTLTPGNQQERIDAIADKYETDYFLWTGVISLRDKTAYKRLVLLPLVIIAALPVAPFVLYSAVKPRYEMLHFSILYDVRTGRRQVIKFGTFEKRASDAMVKAHLYDTFWQIKQKE